MIDFDLEDEIEELTLRPEIWWHDAVYHETDHCVKWPHSANVCISDLGRPRVLSFSERLVSFGKQLVNSCSLSECPSICQSITPPRALSSWSFHSNCITFAENTHLIFLATLATKWYIYKAWRGIEYRCPTAFQGNLLNFKVISRLWNDAQSLKGHRRGGGWGWGLF